MGIIKMLSIVKVGRQLQQAVTRPVVRLDWSLTVEDI